MPVLLNNRHELFVQALAKGVNELDAYVEAGFCPDKGNPYRLAKLPHIQRRLAELLERSAKRVEVNAERVIQSLAKIAFFDASTCLVVDDNGETQIDLSRLDADTASALDVAVETDAEGKRRKTRVKTVDHATRRAALETLGKVFALWTDKVEHKHDPTSFAAAQTTDELLERMRSQLGDEDTEAFMQLVGAKPN